MDRVLSDSDLKSAVWQKLKRHFEARLTDHRVENDSVRLTDIDTAYKRGRIAEAKHVLGLSDPDPVITE